MTPKNLCTRCQKVSAVPGKKRCEGCSTAARRYWADRIERIPPGACSRCGNNQTEAGYKQCVDCRYQQAQDIKKWREKDLEGNRFYQREYRQKRRQLVVDHYGGACACCAETTYEFLSLDHIDGGGNIHRRQLRGNNLVPWIIANNFPSGYRVLCHNCNSAIGYYGKCPHGLTAERLAETTQTGV